MISRLVVLSMGIGTLTWQAKPQSLALAEGETSFPMLDVGGRPVADVRINGKGPYRGVHRRHRGACDGDRQCAIA